MNAVAHTKSSPQAAVLWESIKNVGADVKIELISLLSDSLIHAVVVKEHKKNWAQKYAGRWQDSKTAEEMVDDMRSSRTFNREIDL